MKTNLKKSNKITVEKFLILSSLFMIGVILIFVLINTLPPKMNEEEIYPKGSITNSKIFNISHNEIPISITKEDTNYIIQTINQADKELISEYGEGLIEINISFTDSTIQLLPKDSDTVYYVFHDKTYNGICYEVKSKELNEYLKNAIAKVL